MKRWEQKEGQRAERGCACVQVHTSTCTGRGWSQVSPTPTWPSSPRPHAYRLLIALWDMRRIAALAARAFAAAPPLLSLPPRVNQSCAKAAVVLVRPLCSLLVMMRWHCSKSVCVVRHWARALPRVL